VDIDGIRMRICVALVDDLAVGEYVLVHTGFAIHKLDLDKAIKTLELLRRMVNDHENAE